jgi:hypothetical protein
MLISLGAGCEVRGAGGVSPLHVATSVQLVRAAQQAFKHQSNMILLFTAVFAFESVRLQCQVCIPSCNCNFSSSANAFFTQRV